ncbi:hypothetical protein A2U01_0075024, partial [Trifolium medium]|nr:hypothetical protein [Trifolium medium]
MPSERNATPRQAETGSMKRSDHYGTSIDT